MAVNIVGTGLIPQSRPNATVLGLNDDQVEDFTNQCEWAFKLWSREADASERLNFDQIQYTTIMSILGAGESFRIPVTIDDPGKKFSMSLQRVGSLRCFTPSDLTTDMTIRDGIKHGNRNQPLGYWFGNSKTNYSVGSLTSKNCKFIPAKKGHRPGVLHTFIQKKDEDVRGTSILSPAMKYFRDLSDYLDFELVGAIIASSFPVFIETSDPYGTANIKKDPTGEEKRYQSTAPGEIMYGGLNQKPHILKSDRPSNTFDSFVERILRAVGASVGMPYEVIAKDFSKTNYSSARAALLEAWRVFSFYQKWLVDQFCQPVWEMVIEEAYLRDIIKLPAGSPGFYEQREAWTSAIWIPPRKGSVDPAKEIDAYIKAKDHNFMTDAYICAEYSGDDYNEVFKQRSRETKKERKLEIVPPATIDKTSDVIIAEKESGDEENDN